METSFRHHVISFNADSQKYIFNNKLFKEYNNHLHIFIDNGQQFMGLSLEKL